MPSDEPLLLAQRYQLEQRIAAGGFGEVWRGTDLTLARTVAIKLLLAGYTQHPETLDRFRAEARHAGALSHQNIARVYDYGEPEASHPPFLVMELVEGPSLAGILAGGPMGPGRAMDVLAQAAAGLHVAHQAGLVHRDIKPGNLLLSGTGPVKITDFGIAFAAGCAPITMTGMVIGTAGYMAPERVDGRRATAAGDLYSLGIVAYECLTGAAPFTGTALEVAIAHRDRPLPPLPPSVPAPVAALVGELTAKDPAARPHSAEEVARRAAQLRDCLASGANDQMASIGEAEHATVTERPAPALAQSATVARAPAPARQGRQGRHRLGRVAMGAGAAAALLGLVMFGARGRLEAAPRPAALPSASGPAVRMVEVDVSSLVGQPVSVAVRRLDELGLSARVLWQQSGQQAPGSVLSAVPGGRLPVGSLVTVTGALQPSGSNGTSTASSNSPGDAPAGGGGGEASGHRHGDGHRRGKGNGPGKGDGHGARHGGHQQN